MTIDVAKLRRFAEEAGWPSVTPTEFVELLDAYEERDRLRAACSHEFVPDGWVVTDSWLDVATGMAIPNAWQPTHYRCKKCLARVSVAALEGRK